ncbi:tape measure protein [Corynebacterium pygosceleis]|uniref:tape measure protein n=1 Tax=Corynebacterium pygosceleis TaxID=2800406 RepID=UPI00200668B5|nr:tape measure protein [Corynebacterium pygosceleis]MCK7676362.1 tape measure protein [Corynebacterium pygosceleis]
MSVELGVGYLSIVPETSKIAPGIASALDKAEGGASKAGKSIGDRLGGAMGKALKVTAAGTGAAVGGVLAASMAKGFGRLSAIDQAQAKLTGLGNSTETVANIMDNALASVKGTAFGLGEAATTSAGMVAAGIKPGEELERRLKNVADAAAIAGTSMDDMGLIFGSVAARGKLQGDDMLQLLSRGVPVLQMLAEETGKTTEEVSNMVSKGKIDFETFANAMEKGVGGSALKMGDTVQGAWANMWAAAGRFGAEVMKPAFQLAPPVFGALTAVADQATNAVKPLAAQLGEKLAPSVKAAAERLPELAAGFGQLLSSGVERLGSLWESLRTDPQAQAQWAQFKDLLGQVKVTAGELWPAFVDVGKTVGSALGAVQVETWRLLGETLNVATPIIKSLLETMAEHPDAVAAFVTAWAGMKVVGTITGPVGKGVGALRELGGAAKFAKDALKGSDSVGAAMVNLAGGASSANPKIAKLGGVFTTLGGKLFKVGNVMQVLRRVGAPIIRVLGTAIRFINPWVAAVTVLGGALWAFFTKTERGREIWSGFMDLLNGAWTWIKDTFAGVWDVVADKFGAAWDRVSAIFGGLKSLWIDGDFTSGLGQALGIDEDSPLVAWALDARKAVVDVYDTVSGFIGGLKALIVDGDFTAQFGQMLGLEEDSPIIAGILTIRDKIFGAVDAIKTKWSEFTGLFSGLKSLIVDGDFTSELGRALGIEEDSPLVTGILGFRDKVIGAYNTIRDKAHEIAQSVSDRWSQMTQAFSDKWNEASTTVTPLLDTLREKWDAFASGLGEKYREHIAPHVDALKTKIGEMSDKFREFLERLWEPVLKPALITLGALLVGPIVLAFGAVVLAIGAVVAVIGTLAYVVLSMPGWISSAIQKVNEWWDTLKQRVTAVIDVIKLAIKAWYDDHIAPLPKKVGDAITGVIDWFKKLPGQIQSQFANAGRWLVDAGKRVMGGLLDGLRSKFGEVKSWISDHLSFNLGGLVGNAQGAGYRAYVDGGIDRLERYANGGHREEHRAQIAPAGAWRVWAEPETGGEAYIPLAASKRSRSTAILDKTARIFGLALVDPRTGGAPGIGYRGDLGSARPQVFEDGGLVPSAEIKRRLKPLDGTPYIFGGWSMAGTDCSGAVAMVDNAFRSLALLTERMSTQTEAAFLSNRGYRRGQGGDGDMRVGFVNGGPGGGHTAIQLPDGTYVESGGNTGGGLTIGRKAGPLTGRGFTDFFYHRGVDGIVNALGGESSQLSSTLVGDYDGGPGAFSKAINPSFGEADSLYQDALKYLTRTRLYDTGGVLPHGGSAVNLSGKPELILNNAWWGSFSKMADALPGLVQVLNKQVESRAASAEEIKTAGFSDTATGIEAAHRAVYSFGRHLGGDFLGQVQIVADAEKGLADTRAAVLQDAAVMERREEELAEARAELAKVTAEGGGLSVSMTRRLADAEEGLTKARASTGAGKPERIAAAEKKLARAREDADSQLEKSADKNAAKVKTALNKVQKATDKLADAEEKSETIAERLAAAERAVAAARYKAIGQLTQQTLDAFASGFSAMEKFHAEMGRLTEMAERTKQEVSKLQQQQITLRMQGIEAAHNVQQAEWGLSAARMDGLLSVARAEVNLREVREGALRLGATSVEALSARIAEFRRTGVWAINGVRDASTVTAQKIKIAEAELAQARADAARQELLAEKKRQLAGLESMKATLMQQKAAKLLSLHTEKLRAQTAELYGMSSATHGKAQRQASGISRLLAGLGKVAGGLATGAAGFATAGPLGAIPGALLAFGGLGELIGGGAQISANRGGLREAWDESDLRGKLGILFGVGGGAAAAVAGGAYAAQTGDPNGIVGGAQLGSKITETVFGSMADVAKANTEAAVAGIDESITRAELSFSEQLARLVAREEATKLEFLDKEAVADASVKLASLQAEIAKASSKEETKVLTEYSKRAEAHRDRLVASAAERARLLDQIREDGLGRGKQSKVVKYVVPEDALFNPRGMDAALQHLADEVGGVRVEVEEIKAKSKPTSVDVVSARRGY